MGPIFLLFLRALSIFPKFLLCRKSGLFAIGLLNKVPCVTQQKLDLKANLFIYSADVLLLASFSHSLQLHRYRQLKKYTSILMQLSLYKHVVCHNEVRNRIPVTNSPLFHRYDLGGSIVRNQRQIM